MFVYGLADDGVVATRDAEESATASTDHAAVVMDALRRLVRALAVADQATRASLGVTAAQLFVLRETQRAKVATISELARRTATAQSSVSEVVGRLVTRGLLRRKRGELDHRRAEISLSPSGRALLLRARETVQERLLGAFARLSDEQRRQIADSLALWLRESGFDELKATMFFEP